MQHMNRIPPNGQVGDYKTYQILAPLSTHWTAATCAEVNCEQYQKGWRVRVEGLPPDMLHTAKTSGRAFSELHVAEGENWLVFKAGQPCFRASQHRRIKDKQEIFVVRDGDHRGNPTGNVRKHTRPEFWVEDMAENLDRINEMHRQQ